MVADDGIMELLENLLALVRVDVIDVLWERADGEDALPSSHGIGAYDGMYGRKGLAYVLWGAPCLRVQCRSPGFSSLDESVADEGRGQALQEFLNRLTEAFIDLVPRCPECVTACLGELDQSQASVVSGDRLELDVAVPLGGIVLSLVLFIRDVEELSAMHR